jgi:hypothetical protein
MHDDAPPQFLFAVQEFLNIFLEQGIGQVNQQHGLLIPLI